MSHKLRLIPLKVTLSSLLVLTLIFLTFLLLPYPGSGFPKLNNEPGWGISTASHVYNFGDTVTFLVTKPQTPPGHNCIVDVTFYILAILPDGSQNDLGPLSFPDTAGTYAVSAGQAGSPPGTRLAQLWGQSGVGCVNPPPSPSLYAATTYVVQGATTTPSPTCQGGQYWNGAQCVCPLGQQWNGQQCVVSTPLQISISAAPGSGDAPLTVAFVSNAKGGTPPYLFNWDFGDGSRSSDANPSHVFSSPSTYHVTLQVSDAHGAQVSQSIDIPVTESTNHVTFIAIVVDAYSGVPIQGATVSLDGYAAGVTDSNGRAVLSANVPPSNHHYGVDVEGYTSVQGIWSLSQNSGGSFTVRMSPKSTLRGVYFDQGGGTISWNDPVFQGRYFQFQIDDEGTNGYTDTIEIIDSNPKRWYGSCILGHCWGEYMHPVEDKVTLKQPGRAAMSVYVDSDTPPGTYTIYVQVTYAPFNIRERGTVPITVRIASNQLIAPAFDLREFSRTAVFLTRNVNPPAAELKVTQVPTTIVDTEEVEIALVDLV
jgi:PKD repeat protein